jgi:hypothetical protein
MVDVVSGEGRDAEAGGSESLASEELVPRRLGRLGRVVRQAQGLRGARGHHGRPVPHGDDRLDRVRRGVVQDDADRPVRILEAHGESAVPPRVIHPATVIRPEDGHHAELPRRRDEVVRFVAGGGEQEEKARYSGRMFGGSDVRMFGTIRAHSRH